MTTSLPRLRGRIHLLRAAAEHLSTPLSPDDYLALINPLWSARDLRGRIVSVTPETENAATLAIKPGRRWVFDHQPGQYIGIAVAIRGRFHWRSYSLTCPPHHRHAHLTVTVKALPGGLVSNHLVRHIDPGTTVRLASPRGEFVLPDPPPAKLLFLTAGTGITPVMAMLRTLDRRGLVPDVLLLHSNPDGDTMLFRSELHDLARRHTGLDVRERFTRRAGRLTLPADLDRLLPDWRERHAWVCGPSTMLEQAEQAWAAAGVADSLHTERFGVPLTDAGIVDGTVHFVRSGLSVEADGATTLLQAGERAGITMPFGCRAGLCHTCLVPLIKGRVRDQRDGTRHDARRQQIQTCITAAEGDCVLDL